MEQPSLHLPFILSQQTFTFNLSLFKKKELPEYTKAHKVFFIFFVSALHHVHAARHDSSLNPGKYTLTAASTLCTCTHAEDLSDCLRATMPF